MKVEGSILKLFNADSAQVDKGDSAVDLNDPDRTGISVSLDSAKMEPDVYMVQWTTRMKPAAAPTVPAPEATGAAAAPAVAPTEVAPSNTLPTTGASDNYGLFTLLAVFGLSLLGTGTLIFLRNSRQ